MQHNHRKSRLRSVCGRRCQKDHADTAPLDVVRPVGRASTVRERQRPSDCLLCASSQGDPPVNAATRKTACLDRLRPVSSAKALHQLRNHLPALAGERLATFWIRQSTLETAFKLCRDSLSLSLSLSLSVVVDLASAAGVRSSMACQSLPHEVPAADPQSSFPHATGIASCPGGSE